MPRIKWTPSEHHENVYDGMIGEDMVYEAVKPMNHWRWTVSKWGQKGIIDLGWYDTLRQAKEACEADLKG